MFEAVELGQTLSKDDYKALVPDLRLALVNAQYELRLADFPLIVVVTGDDRAACNAVLNRLMEWMDARYIEAFYFGRPSEEERQRPAFWRYWCALPPRGKTGMFMGGWISESLSQRVHRRIGKAEFEQRCQQIRRFEQALADDGALILKFWLHLPQELHQQRFGGAERLPKEQAWSSPKHYCKLLRGGEQLVRITSTAMTPWILVDSSDLRYCTSRVGQTILQALTAQLQARSQPASPERPVALPATVTLANHHTTVLSQVDLSTSLDWQAYRPQMDAAQGQLNRLSQQAFDQAISAVLVFEGWDAAGKGGVIRRLTQAMDAQTYKVIPIGVPTDEELAHHYLWRFWRQLPRAGRMLIFDRSWYGRVLVERVEQFASEPQWQRAYGEINDFEQQLSDRGIILLKFWLHIDAEEQLRRFKAREGTPYKKYKITAEDYRNREKWPDYEAAVSDLVTNTSTAAARWHLVAANDKRHARLQVIQTCCQALKQALS